MNPEIVIDYTNTTVSLEEIPCEWVTAFEERLSPSEKKEWGRWDKIYKVWHILRDQNYQNAILLAESMRMEEVLKLSCEAPYVVVAHTKGRKSGIELAKEWGMYDMAANTWGSRFKPSSMWDEAAHQRNGDAVIMLLGNDKGYSRDWEYFVVVKWEPQVIQGWMIARDLYYHE